MSEEGNNLYDLLFPGIAIDDVSAQYLQKLGEYNIESLLREPSRLKEEKISVNDQMQELATANYKTFIQTAECSRSIYKQFQSSENHLESLIKDVKTFEDSCGLFISKTSDISSQRRINSITLTRNAQLLEILELPQLMESFIRNEQFEDALELSIYARRLHAKHNNIKIFSKISADIEKSWKLMLKKLLDQLKSDLALPTCLQVVGYLRRMNYFTEAELRFKFLEMRDIWFQTMLDSIPKDDLNKHLTKTIELTRVHLFNIITQYKAIFNDDDHNPLFGVSDHNTELSIFHVWILKKVENFLTVLEENLSKDIHSIDSIVGQCMYFGSSFTRIGCDFRGLMIPVFTKVILKKFSDCMNRATVDFSKTMENYTLINKTVQITNKKPNKENRGYPPDSLIEFYPLSEYCNQVLTGFNELKLCAPLQIAGEVCIIIEESLASVAKTILEFYGQEQQAFNSPAREAFTRMCRSFAEEFVPYLQDSLYKIYSPAQLADYFGIPTQKLQSNKMIMIDKSKIEQSIGAFLPLRIEPELLKDTDEKVELKEFSTGDI